MTTRIRVQHLDSVYKTEVLVMDEYPPGTHTEAQKIALPEKGDETEVYLTSTRYLIVREVPPET